MVSIAAQMGETRSAGEITKAHGILLSCNLLPIVGLVKIQESYKIKFVSG